MWAFLNFNTELKGPEDFRHVVAEWFVQSFCELNNVDLVDHENIERLFSHKMAALDRGPAKLLKGANNQQYNQQRYFLLKELVEDKESRYRY